MEIQDKFEHLKKEALPEAVEGLRLAQEDDPDLVENVAYGNALEKKNQIEQDIARLEDIIRNHKIIEGGRKDVVSLGSAVVVEVGGRKDQFRIVGSLEADPVEGKISDESPVGKALLGAKPGDTIEVAGSIVRAAYKVLSIE